MRFKEKAASPADERGTIRYYYFVFHIHAFSLCTNNPVEPWN